MCKHMKWQDGHRTYSGNVPGYAQGAYFPGDEPGYYCRETGEMCMADSEPDSCPMIKHTGRFCEDCEIEDGVALPIWRNAYGTEFCRKGHIL